MSEETKPRKLPESRFALAEHKRNAWLVVPEEGTTFDALMDPAYWAHNARKTQPGDWIEVVPDEESYWALLRVTKVAPVGVIVDVLIHKEAGPAVDLPAEMAVNFDVQWKGPHHRWAVIRTDTRETIQTGFPSRNDGAKWVGENARNLSVGKAA